MKNSLYLFLLMGFINSQPSVVTAEVNPATTRVELLCKSDSITLSDASPSTRIALSSTTIETLAEILQISLSHIENPQHQGLMLCSYFVTDIGVEDIPIGCVGLYPVAQSQARDYVLGVTKAQQSLREVVADLPSDAALLLRIMAVDPATTLKPVQIKIDSLQWLANTR
ncbi:MAG: hypothetical protein HY080_16840 [Gammaproteobacteria bacterium]|nr:hypothetical protein [Gammaproteobacteria bacterium]